MNRRRTMALAAAFAVTFDAGAYAQETQPAPGTTTTTPATAVKPVTFNDWALFCPQPKSASEVRICEIRTIITGKDGRHLGALAVAAIEEPKTRQSQVIASALLPLGVDLTAEALLKVDEGKPMPLKYLRCLQRGCEAMTPLSGEQQSALQSGTKAKVAVGIGGGREAVFDFSLNGFTAALDAMKKSSGVK